jgi:formylglycine-generating enzyme required for sulfatase activity
MTMENHCHWWCSILIVYLLVITHPHVHACCSPSKQSFTTTTSTKATPTPTPTPSTEVSVSSFENDDQVLTTMTSNCPTSRDAIDHATNDNQQCNDSPSPPTPSASPSSVGPVGEPSSSSPSPSSSSRLRAVDALFCDYIRHHYQSSGDLRVPSSLYPDRSHTYIDHQTVTIPSGHFLMGTRQPILLSDGEGPQRYVDIDSFEMDAFEVSNAQFAQFACHRYYHTNSNSNEKKKKGSDGNTNTIDEYGYITESETFGWSFVLHWDISASLSDTDIRGYVQGAEWWAAVSGANWRRPEGGHSDILSPVARHTLAKLSSPRKTTSIDKGDHNDGSVDIDTDTIITDDNELIVGASNDEQGDYDDGAGILSRHSRLNHPVIHVSHNDAIAFCQWRGMRLPTEVVLPSFLSYMMIDHSYHGRP